MKKILPLSHRGTIKLTKTGALALNNYYRYKGVGLTAKEGDEYTNTIKDIIIIFGSYMDSANLPFDGIEIG